jgi:hypothetical protein
MQERSHMYVYRQAAGDNEEQKAVGGKLRKEG